MNSVVVLVTASSLPEAKKLATGLVSGRLAACVNVLPGVWSTYWWKGKQESAPEVMLVIKTERRRLTTLIQIVKKLHSYTVPEVIALPITGGSKEYLAWLHDSLGV